MSTKQPAPIKTDLFRFVTIRTPQLISDEKKKWGFIYHPDLSKSYFFKNSSPDSIDAARTIIKERCATFKPVSSANDIKKLIPDLFEFTQWLTRNKNVFTEEQLAEKAKTVKKLLPENRIHVWDNLLFQVGECEDPILRQVCIQLLIADNFLAVCEQKDIRKIAETLIQTPKAPVAPAIAERPLLFLRKVANAKVVVPKEFSIKKKNEVSNKPDELNTDDKKTEKERKKKKKSGSVGLFGVNKLGVAVLRKVEQEVCCYVPGEVSRIENVLAKEYKERHTRSLISSEVTEEETSETEIENQSDTVSTSRNELQSEIANSLTNNNSISTGASLGVTAEGGFLGNGGSMAASGYFDFASSTSATSSDSEAQTFAQEITSSALERVLQKTTQKRTSRILQEFEENNRHGFDNREGIQHITGVYRWVDIIYTNRLINYGKQLMYEFLIPEPAKLYRDVMHAGSRVKKNESNLQAPKHPSENGIKSANDITGYATKNGDETIPPNYIAKAEKYGVTPAAPPDEKKYEEETFAKSGLKETEEFSGMGKIAIPQGYHCNYAEANVQYRHDSRNSEGTHWVITVGGKDWKKNIQNMGNDDRVFKNNDEPIPFEFDNYLTELINVSYSGDRTLSYTISVTITCKVLPEEYAKWQNGVYKQIMEAYEKELKQYEEDQKNNNDSKNDKPTASNNTEFNRTVEQRELQRIAIEMLTKPFNIQMGGDFYYEGKKCRIPLVDQTNEWEDYASHVKFFEQAFDWKLMSYLFYPYYWADKCDWRDLFQTEPSADPIFQAFLQSGMARAVVPVTKGFEEAVNFYLETGDIWNGGGLVMDTDDDLYISVESELQELEGFVEDEWQTRVPTTLTILQGKSVYLEDEALPCCNKLDEVHVDTLLRPSNAILGQKTPTT